MADQTPDLREELSTAAGRRIWGMTLGVAALLLVVMLAFLILRKYVLPPPPGPVAPKTQTVQP